LARWASEGRAIATAGRWRLVGYNPAHAWNFSKLLETRGGMAAPETVSKLVEQFEHNRESYERSGYNETQLRREFLDPFFKALGWDVDNEHGNAEAYKDVIHEDAIKVGGATKAPDYCFRVGGRRIFFLEAKKPSVNVRDDVSAAYQLRRYAWSAKLPLSILSDFDELAVYDCRIKPDKSDKPAVGRVLLLTCTEFVERWDELAGIFSREAVLKGSFDKFAESSKLKRGTAEVDTAFLGEIESWRETLARNFALRNSRLGQRDLNFAVQRTIDRVIFLRMCEDRGVESYGQLAGVSNGEHTYRRLHQLFDRADERYNLGLFHFQAEKGRAEDPDQLTPSLKLDDKPLKEILRGLYYPDCPYEFSVLPAEILGQVHEQFLGKVIRLTAAHQARIEDKPEVKKAGGVYYTPAYIVDYIVKNTVGTLVEGKSPKEAARLTVLDPACGSGSFLVGAFQYLLDWHRDWYVADSARKHTKQVYEGPGGQWLLTTAEKKRILLNNIYGVDIDSQAVEVTKLSLLLKVLEKENNETLERQLRMLHERALPDLGNNIKCGNSLIGADFYNGQQMSLLDDEEQYRINVFDWKAEFPTIFKGKSGGFDAVIGNPPYIRMEEFKELKTYLKERFACHDERADLYVYFIEREHNLLRRHGRFGMIVSNKFVRAKYGQEIREFLTNVANIDRIVDLAGLPVFRGATVRTIVIITTKDGGKKGLSYSPPIDRETLAGVQSGAKTLDEVVDPVAYDVSVEQLSTAGWNLNGKRETKLLKKLRITGTPLVEVAGGRICRGVVSGLTEAFVVNREQRDALVDENPEAARLLRPFVQGRDILAYSIQPRDEFLIYTYHGIDMDPFPAVLEHLRPFKQQLQKRATKQAWYELQQPQLAYREIMERPKIVFPDIATTCRFAVDTDGRFGANTVYFLPLADPILLGLLNSRVAQFYFAQTCAALEGPGESYLRFFGQYLEGFPVQLPSDDRHLGKEKMASLVEQRASLQVRFESARTGNEKTRLQRQIDAADRQIDQFVYELYSLTDQEIALVESASE
jgi:hypothetical protein